MSSGLDAIRSSIEEAKNQMKTGSKQVKVKQNRNAGVEDRDRMDRAFPKRQKRSVPLRRDDRRSWRREKVLELIAYQKSQNKEMV